MIILNDPACRNPKKNQAGKNEHFVLDCRIRGVFLRNSKLRLLPPVNEVIAELAKTDVCNGYELSAITWAVRKALEKARKILLDDLNQDGEELNSGKTKKLQNFLYCQPEEFVPVFRAWLYKEIRAELRGYGSMKRVINATGVILHTNCGRALLAPEAAAYVAEQAVVYSNLELNLETGNRGSRYSHIEEILAELTGAEASLVVNNNAAAVLLIMNTFAVHKEVIVSRGELVEVGGSFRIPEVLKAGGAKLVEVGATNKTWLKDYQEAIGPETAMLLKVHTSNYRIQGFQHEVPVDELVVLGKESGIPVVVDLGSGSFLDGSEYGLPQEPTVQDTLKSGASLVSFSGDKLLGGPQAGIIIGKKELIDCLKKNQLTRALRVDKLVLAALIGTLRFYQRGEIGKIPVWNMLSHTKDDLRKDALKLSEMLAGLPGLEIQVMDAESCVGGGAFPTAVLPTYVCAVKPKQNSVVDLESFLRQGDVPILARIVKDAVVFDPRTLLSEDYQVIADRLREWNP